MKSMIPLLFIAFVLGGCSNDLNDGRPATCEAEYIGGTPAMQKWIMENVNYPEEAMENDEQGKVYVLFVVKENGKVLFLRLENHVSPSLDREAKRLILIMPDWLPAKKQGKPVATRCRLPINFTLN